MAADEKSSRMPGVPDAILKEAAIWHARMREPDASSNRRAAFAEWLRSNALHAQAYSETEQLWQALQAPAERVLAAESIIPHLARQTGRGRRLAAWRWGAIAACLLLVAGGWLGWNLGVLDDLRSDYVTATGEHRSVTLADGSDVILNTDTALAVDFEGDRRAVRLFRGEAWFSVAHDVARPFVVETPEGTVRVTGTRFNLRLTGTRAIVSLVEGRVELASTGAAAPGVVLNPGQQTAMRASAIDAPTAFDAASVTAWRRGQMVFYQAPLEQVVDQINRYREGRILVASSRLRDLRVTGVFDAGNPDAALAVIQDTLHVEVIRLTRYLILLR